MTNPYLGDLLAQPAALQATLLTLEAATDLTAIARRLKRGGYRHVVLTGMGSSYHALHPLWLQMVAARVPAYQVETSELIHTAPALLGKDALVVAVSQSGRSIETLRLLELQTGSLLGVTNTADSPLARQAEQVFLTQAGEESSVSCKTYITALAALAVLGSALSGENSQALLGALAPVPQAMACYLENWQGHVAALGEELKGVQSLMIAGRGVSLAAAGTGALIIKEAAHFPTEGMSSAALRHGPLNMASPRLFTMVYAGEDRFSAMHARLVRDIRAAGGKAELVHTAEDGGAFSLPAVPPAGLPLVEILPAQMLSLAAAVLSGWTAGEFTHSTKITSIE